MHYLLSRSLESFAAKVFSTNVTSIILFLLLCDRRRHPSSAAAAAAGRGCTTKSIRLFRQSSSCAWRAKFRGRRRILPFSRNPQRLFLHYFRRRIADPPTGDRSRSENRERERNRRGKRVEEGCTRGRRGGRGEKRRRWLCGAEERNSRAPAWSARGKTRATSFIDWNR